MKKHLFTMAFLLGAIAVIWVGVGFISSSVLSLLMTVTIGMVYVFGAFELHKFRQASASLEVALLEIPDTLPNLGDWLVKVHPSLQNSVRLRIEGERMGLPGPALTPYLVGLLVMLGMLGTFLGMVITLNGAAFSLEGTADLQIIRSALAAPIKGLGLAFGTSVAGVATSAMLGLMSALSRRERMQAAQLLDSKIATSLCGFSLTHQRQETYKALQFQAQALPEVVNKLQALMLQMEDMSQQLNQRLLSNQDSFHKEVKGIYSDLAFSVDQSLKNSLSHSAQLAGESIKPVLEAAMKAIAEDAKLMQQSLVSSAQMQLDGFASRLDATVSTVASRWTAAHTKHEQANANLVTDVGRSLNAFAETFGQRSGALVNTVNEAYTRMQVDQAVRDQQREAAWTDSLQTIATTLQREWQQTGTQALLQQQEICNTLARTAQEITEHAQTSARNTLGEITQLMASSEALVRSRIESDAFWTQQHTERADQLFHLLRTELADLREEESQRGHAAVDRLGELQTALARHLTTLGTALEQPITRLLESASEAPRAAAEVIGQLRQEISNSSARDNELLEERSRIMSTLNSLLEAINHASVEQRSVIDALVASSKLALNHASNDFAVQLGLESSKLSDIAAHVTSSAVEVSSLGETFGFAVQAFNDANAKLIVHLQRIEAAMDKSMTRSDEQLAYYVAQAREIIDLSIMSQKEIFEELHKLPGKQVVSDQDIS